MKPKDGAGKEAGRKPRWVIEKEKARRAEASETFWLFGLHAVRDALENPARHKLTLIVTKNASDKLADAIRVAELEPQMADPRRFSAPLDPGSVHQGAALEVRPLDWGGLETACTTTRPGQNEKGAPCILLLDRVTDPHNVGAILRSAEVFGARAVIAPRHHAAPETGALAKAASGALERQPYLRVPNLARAIEQVRNMGFLVLGLDGTADHTIETEVEGAHGRPIALVLGAEGPGLRQKTRESCDKLVRIPFAGGFGSLNVSNAAAVGLYAIKATGENNGP